MTIPHERIACHFGCFHFFQPAGRVVFGKNEAKLAKKNVDSASSSES
jgi:hypothetical protein